MDLQAVFGILVILCSVANLASMGLELNPREVVKSLLSGRLVILSFAWGWVVGPACESLLTPIHPPAKARVPVMILLAGPVPAIVAFFLARLFASRAGETAAGGAA